MITVLEKYRRLSDRERWEALRRMSPEESIAIGEALLTSELMTVAEFPEEPEHRSLAILLGIVPNAARTWGACDFQLDLILASLPFEEAARARASVRELFGARLPFPSPEDMILFKVLAGRDKDLLDATGIARRHGGRLDVAYLERTLESLGELAEDDSPWRRLHDVLARARGDARE